MSLNMGQFNTNAPVTGLVYRGVIAGGQEDLSIPCLRTEGGQWRLRQPGSNRVIEQGGLHGIAATKTATSAGNYLTPPPLVTLCCCWPRYSCIHTGLVTVRPLVELTRQGGTILLYYHIILYYVILSYIYILYYHFLFLSTLLQKVVLLLVSLIINKLVAV